MLKKQNKQKKDLAVFTKNVVHYSVDCASRLISISSVTETEQKHKESERNNQRERQRERDISWK